MSEDKQTSDPIRAKDGTNRGNPTAVSTAFIDRVELKIDEKLRSMIENHRRQNRHLNNEELADRIDAWAGKVRDLVCQR